MSERAQGAGSGYIQSQLLRLQEDRQRAGERAGDASGKVIHNHDGLLCQAAAAIADEAGRLCDEATEAALRRAESRAWKAALTLAAPWGSGRAQVMCWLGLAVGAPTLAWMIGLGTTTAALLFIAGYVGLVHWGRGREAMRSSQGERDAISDFRALKPQLIAVASEPGTNPDYPYQATKAPVGEEEDFTFTLRIAKEHGQQFGATFVGMREAGGKVRLLVRLPVDGFTVQAVPFNDMTAGDPRLPVWAALATDLAAVAAVHASKIRTFAGEVADWFAAQARVRLIEQRIGTLAGLERAWSDVALPEETLDGILRLVDTFKSGRPVKGILLYGPPGTGKTLVARKLAQHSGCNFVAVGVSDLKGQHVGHTGPKVRETWQKCRKGAPTILFVDECESVFAARGSANSDAFSDELVQTFLAEWDGFNQSAGQVFVVGATNRHDLIDNAIMSRFTETFEIGVPDARGRERILTNELARARLDFRPTEDMVRETAGMSGRDIHTLVSKIVAAHVDGEVSQEVFAEEVRRLRGKGSTSVERLSWDDLVLPESTLAEFRSLGRELVHAEELRQLGVGVPRGILLYGPPGTGKTQVARVLASESGLAFIAASSSDLKAGYTGQSGGRVKQLFEKARTQAPCILFLDEIDTVARQRGGGDSFTDEIVAQLLQELDGVATRKGQVFLLAASNHPDSIDGALLSRFERRIEIGLPDEAARAAILALQLASKPVAFEVAPVCAALAARTAGLSGRDLQSLVTSATRRALQRAMEQHGDPRLLSLSLEDLESSLPATA